MRKASRTARRILKTIGYRMTRTVRRAKTPSGEREKSAEKLMKGPDVVDEGNEGVTMKRSILCLLLVLAAAAAMAGDLAVLENLGFSADGRYFMFGQHVLVTDAGQAYAEVALVDVPRNDFVPGGWKKSSWNVRILPNQDSRGALYELLSESTDLKKRYGISHLEQGRLLYARNNGDDTMTDAAEGEEAVPALSFRDFERGREFSMALYQEELAEGEGPAASFHIELTVVEPSGVEESYVVGRKGYHRDGVAAYSIVRVWAGPDGRSLVIVVAKEAADLSVRYMVETLVLN